MEVKRLKENGQVKDKFETLKNCPNLFKQDHSKGTSPKLVQCSLKRVHSSEVVLLS